MSNSSGGEARRDVPRSVFVLAGVAAAVAWVPMLLLAIAERMAEGRPDATRAFLGDFTTHVRLLLAIPLLIVADVLVGCAFARCEEHIEEPGLLDPRDEPRVREGIRVARRLRGSPVVSVLIALLVFGIAFGTRGENIGSWAYLEARRSEGSWPAQWLGFVAFPAFRFFLLRYLYRWLVWAGFLFWLRRFELRLIATHPDRCGGLGFLTVPISASLGVVFGVSATGAMAWRQAVISHAAPLAQVRAQALMFAAVWLVVFLGPLLVFTPRLLRLKRVALVQYSQLGSEYTRAFQEKWLHAHAGGETLLGTSDIQSLADLGTSMDVVQTLRPTPIDLHVLLSVLVVYAVALLPVILSQISIDELLARLVKVVL